MTLAGPTCIVDEDVAECRPEEVTCDVVVW